MIAVTFLRSLRLDLTIVHTWLTEGRLEDWRGVHLLRQGGGEGGRAGGAFVILAQ